MALKREGKKIPLPGVLMDPQTKLENEVSFTKLPSLRQKQLKKKKVEEEKGFFLVPVFSFSSFIFDAGRNIFPWKEGRNELKKLG